MDMKRNFLIVPNQDILVPALVQEAGQLVYFAGMVSGNKFICVHKVNNTEVNYFLLDSTNYYRNLFL